jgi:hypothetical protein
MREPYIPEYELSKHETNPLFRLVEQSAIPATEFDLATQKISVPINLAHVSRRKGLSTKKGVTTRAATLICHRPTKSYFGVTKDGDKYEAFENVGGTLLEENLPDLFVPYYKVSEGAFDRVLSEFLTWLGRVIKCIEFMDEPDLWSELARFREILTNTDFENTPFTHDEQAVISAQIGRAREYIRTSGELTSEQISRIEARLDHAEEASKRICRKDWIMMVTGSILSLVITDTVTVQVADHIFTVVLHGLGHAFGYGGAPPLPLP